MKNVENISFTVYQHINLINGKIYIGITSKQPQKRWGSNGINYRQNTHFWNAIKKYGWNNFEHKILFTRLSKQEALNIEIELIAFYKSNLDKYGYNKSIGGELIALGCKRTQTQKTKIKISNALSKPIICLDTLKIYKSARMASNELNIDYKYISRVLNKKAKSCHGYHFIFLKEYNENMEYNLFKREKPIICIESGEIFNSISECAKRLNLHKGTLGAILKGSRKTYHNLHFKYYLGD